MEVFVATKYICQNAKMASVAHLVNWLYRLYYDLNWTETELLLYYI